MQVFGASKKQRAVVKLLVEKDLPIFLQLPKVVKISFGTTNLDENDIGAFFGYDFLEDKIFGGEIQLHPKLQGGLLYIVLLHELGHALGLDHARVGIMKPVHASKIRRLTPRNRRKWLLEFSEQLMRKRLRTAI